MICEHPILAGRYEIDQMTLRDLSAHDTGTSGMFLLQYILRTYYTERVQTVLCKITQNIL